MIGPEQPARAVDIVDTHVEQDAAGSWCETDEEAAGILLVGALRAHEEWPTDRAGGDLGMRVTIMRIEAPHKADHDLQSRIARGLLLDAQAIGEIECK